MKANYPYKQKMNYTIVQEVNSAVCVLKHFIHLNKKILPIFRDLSLITHPTEEQKDKIVRIKEAIDYYQFDNTTSLVFFDSPILEIIKTCYDAIILKKEKKTINNYINDFYTEYEKLTHDWEQVEKN